MRIAMLYTPLVTAGGGERQLLEEARQLAARGHDVVVLTYRLDQGALFGASAAQRPRITVLPSRGGWGGQVASLRGALVRLRPDVLLSHTSPELTWLATRFTRTPYVQYHNSPPFYIGEHASPYMASGRYRRVYPRIRGGAAGYEAFARPLRTGAAGRALAEVRTALKHHALRAARAVVVPSRRTARELALLHGVEATVVRGCLPASLLESPHRGDSGPWPTESGGPVVLSVCRLEPVKRVDLLLRAFARVREAVPDARLVIAGTGSERARLEELTQSLWLGDAVRFAGFVPEDQLWDYYAAADVLAAPAMADFIIAPYEAMAAGCRAVWTTEMETEPEIESSGQVFVAAPEEAAFARAIVAALRAPSVARADLRSMTWEARGERIERVCVAAAGEEKVAA